jgi:thiosulfate reductase cytochrome b subunit
VLLVVLALVSAVLVGEAMAVSPARSWSHMAAFALMIALTIWVIIDLEYPRHGLIRLEHFDPVLVDLLEKMR